MNGNNNDCGQMNPSSQNMIQDDPEKKNQEKFKNVPRYRVLIHNDDYTTMEFVVHVLKVVFGKNEEEASAIMLKVHNEGLGVAGVYSKEIAETKVVKVVSMAKASEYPLKASMEPIEDAQ